MFLHKENLFYFTTYCSKKNKGEAAADPKFPYSEKTLKCTHYGQPRPRGKNHRVNLSYNAKGCPVQISIRLIKCSSGMEYKVTKFLQDHI